MSTVHHEAYSGTVYTPNLPRGPANTGLFPQLFPLPLAWSNTLSISVKSSNDAEIILYDEVQDKDTIKICLGSKGNTTSSIGFFDNLIQTKKYPDRVFTTPKILSPNHFKAFIIRWNYGLIKVFNDGDESPFLTWRGPSYLYVGAFGVRTDSSSGVWKTQGGAEFNTVDTNDNKALFQHAKINCGKLDFELKATSDAIVALTTLPAPMHNPMITTSANFLIGNWSNNRSGLYINRAEVAHYDKAATLSRLEYRRFWIKWDSVTIQMGEYGSDIPKMFYTNLTKPLDEMNYFGFMTGLPGAICEGFWNFIADEVEKDESDKDSAKKPESKANCTEVKVFSTNTRYGFVDMSAMLKSVPPAERIFAPDNIYHGGISIFGKAVDFIKESGINEKDESDYFTETPLWIDSKFYTTKTKDEFKDWLQLQKETQFTDKNYELIDNNCLTFVSKACKFLGGQEATKLATQRQFVRKNRDNPEFMVAMSTPPPPKKT